MSMAPQIRNATVAGFVEEGRHRNRVKLQDGTFVDDIAMALLFGGK
jgi:hypothetical protein